MRPALSARASRGSAAGVAETAHAVDETTKSRSDNEAESPAARRPSQVWSGHDIGRRRQEDNVYFRNVGIRKFPTCSGRVALIVGQARLTKRLPLKTQQGNFCGQIGDWRNSPAKCCDSIKYLSSPRAEVVENRPCLRVHPPAQGVRTGVGD